ncbi:hypothetical protein JL101_033560 (plasmid) [Skermanella rosea]|uniref:hypothetical protein n=1 Tax=Skermanella rosea TaxID=1817965 RepID=UPI001933BC57|nr:hypothetical protein [Skermanella rosea]UEM07404.1 hypothetical protein JL101_033560 [Skermanella rosea]
MPLDVPGGPVVDADPVVPVVPVELDPRPDVDDRRRQDGEILHMPELGAVLGEEISLVLHRVDALAGILPHEAADILEHASVHTVEIVAGAAHQDVVVPPAAIQLVKRIVAGAAPDGVGAVAAAQEVVPAVPVQPSPPSSP